MLNYDELRDVYGAGAGAVASEAACGGLGAGDSQDSTRRSSCGARWRIWATGRATICWSSLCTGDIFHVDSIVSEGRVVFSVVHQYGRPPMQVMHEGGVFSTRTVDRASRRMEGTDRAECAAGAVAGDGARRDACRVYSRRMTNGRYYFLEIAARVGGAFIADLVEVATGVNLWREWARLEVTQPARRGLRSAGSAFERLRGQRAVHGQDRGAGHDRL